MPIQLRFANNKKAFSGYPSGLRWRSYNAGGHLVITITAVEEGDAVAKLAFSHTQREQYKWGQAAEKKEDADAPDANGCVGRCFFCKKLIMLVTPSRPRPMPRNLRNVGIKVWLALLHET